MKASKTLARPEYWQDFESLCKKLWGEIWKCPEIKKNGRSGQDQAGVDIYGIPHNETEYYGIQCKGKDEYTHKQLTEKEIDVEIEKAKKFEPKLKKLYFATTAIKNAKIEAFVRVRNVEHKETNLFEIHLFCWEDIVDLINENKETYDYFVNSINFKTNSNVEVTFLNNEEEITVVPKFYNLTLHKEAKPLFAKKMTFEESNRMDILMGATNYSKNTNFSLFPVVLKIQNVGTEAIENFKLEFEFEGEFHSLTDSNKTGVSRSNMAISKPITLTSINGSVAKYTPLQKMLVGSDVTHTDVIYVKPYPVSTILKVHWKLLSKNLQTNGTLRINIEPDIITKLDKVIVDYQSEAGIEESKIVDCIENDSFFGLDN